MMDGECKFRSTNFQLKATLISDFSKTVLVDVNGNDILKLVMAMISEKLKETYDIYNNLQGLRVTHLFKKHAKQQIEDLNQPINKVLKEGEEVYFDLTTQ